MSDVHPRLLGTDKVRQQPAGPLSTRPTSTTSNDIIAVFRKNRVGALKKEKQHSPSFLATVQPMRHMVQPVNKSSTSGIFKWSNKSTTNVGSMALASRGLKPVQLPEGSELRSEPVPGSRAGQRSVTFSRESPSAQAPEVIQPAINTDDLQEQPIWTSSLVLPEIGTESVNTVQQEGESIGEGAHTMVQPPRPATTIPQASRPAPDAGGELDVFVHDFERKAVTPDVNLKYAIVSQGTSSGFLSKAPRRTKTPGSKKKSRKPAASRSGVASWTAMQPQFVEDAQNRLQREVYLLESRYEDGAVHKASGAMAEERFGIFRAFARELYGHFGVYSTLLSRIFAEYDDYVDILERRSLRVLHLEREIHCKEVRHEAEVTTLRNRIEQASDTYNSMVVDLRGKMSHGRNMLELLEEVDEKTRLLRQQVEETDALKERLGVSTRVRADFQRTIRSIEDTFQLISDEKDFQINTLMADANESKRKLEELKESTHHRRLELEDKIDLLEIENDFQKKKCDLLKDRVRQLDNQVLELTMHLQDAGSEIEQLEEKLSEFEGVDLGIKPSKAFDPLLTPRPSKTDACTRIPALQDPSKFQTTASLLNAIYDRYLQMQRKSDHAEQLENYLSELIELHDERDRCCPSRTQLLLVEGGTQTEESYWST